MLKISYENDRVNLEMLYKGESQNSDEPHKALNELKDYLKQHPQILLKMLQIVLAQYMLVRFIVEAIVKILG